MSASLPSPSSKTLRAAIIQIAPVWLQRDATVSKITDWLTRAADSGCDLAVLGETLIPGYPFWIENTDGARFDSKLQKEIHAVYLDQAVDLAAGHLAPIQQAARDTHMTVVFGCYERPSDRGGHTGYCSMVTVDKDGEIANVHRKLMPTYEERLSWGIGDGHGLRVTDVGPFTMGGLNCWENWMPLARASLYAQGENLHVAIWPGCEHNTKNITRFVARESRSYVISASGLMRREWVPDAFPHADVVKGSLPEVSANGGSCVANPDGTWLLEPQGSEEQLVCVDLDLNFVLRERQNFDPSGHYARPDVLKLSVDRRRQKPATFQDE